VSSFWGTAVVDRGGGRGERGLHFGDERRTCGKRKTVRERSLILIIRLSATYIPGESQATVWVLASTWKKVYATAARIIGGGTTFRLRGQRSGAD